MPDPQPTSLPFREAAEFWRRKVNVPTATWRDLQRGDHAHGFMVAGAARQDLLNDLRAAVDKVQAGASIEEFRRDFDDIVARTGWQYNGGRNWRTRIIYQTNLRSAYQAGRWQQMQAIKHRRPYWQYVHNDSVRHPRPEHLSWNGKVLHADDAWWSTHYPPNGYGCECTVRTLAERDMKRLDLKVDDAPTPVDNTDGLDPGFDYNVGEAASSLPAAVRFGQKVMAMPPDWRAIALADAQHRPTDLFADWAGTVARVQHEVTTASAARAAKAAGDTHTPAFPERPTAKGQPVGFVRAEAAQALQDGVGADGQRFASPMPSTALLTANDTQVLHVLREAKGEPQQTLLQVLRDLPTALTNPDTVVLWDTAPAGQRNATPALIYAVPVTDGGYVRLVFHLDSRHGDSTMRRAGVPANWLITATVVQAANLRAGRYVRLAGAWK